VIDVYICVGSSCHLKGSYQILNIFQELIKKYKLEDKVEMKASFCLGHCTSGVALKVENDYIDNVSIENAKEKFDENILKRVESNIE
jgi:NADH:ubiquinone oxidoreductase subunit E